MATSAALYVVIPASWSYSGPSCTSSSGAGSSAGRSTGLQTVTGTSWLVSPESVCGSSRPGTAGAESHQGGA